MPLIESRINTTSLPPVRDARSPEIELLRRAGIIKSGDTIESNFIEEMQLVGLDKGSVLTQLANIMKCGETDSVKLAAVNTALKLYMHPALVVPKGALDKISPVINFQINVPAGGKTQVDMSGILNPAGAKRDDPSVLREAGNIIDVQTEVQTSESW